MYKCKYCGQEFENPYSLGGHTSRCKKNLKYKENCKNCCNYKSLKQLKHLNNSDYFTKEIKERRVFNSLLSLITLLY